MGSELQRLSAASTFERTCISYKNGESDLAVMDLETFIQNGRVSVADTAAAMK